MRKLLSFFMLLSAFPFMNEKVLAAECAPQSEASLSMETELSYPIVQITEDTQEAVLNTYPLLVIDIYADWCGPCQRLMPVYQELNDELGHLYQFAKVNGDQERNLLQTFKVSGFPTLLFFKDGKEVGRQVGFGNKDKLKENIQTYLGK